MKKILFLTLLVCLLIPICSFKNYPPIEAGKKVKWYTWEEAVEANKTTPKKFMIDVYTQWCGWCKKMDKATFEKDEVAKYLNEHFYPVKLNAEQKEDIVFQENTFKYIANAGRRGVHTLAYSLLDGQMSYPSIVFMDESIKRIMISSGYKGPKDFMMELEYAAGEHYKTTHIDEYKAKQKP